MEKHFASLKLLDSDSERTLTRAHSQSDLLSPRQICVQQSYCSENPFGLVRQYSCEQIFDGVTKTRQLQVSEVTQSGYAESRNVWHTTVSYSDSPTANWQFYKGNNLIQASKLATKESPNGMECMEVETLHSVKESEYSSNCQTLDGDISNIKQKVLYTELRKPETKGIEKKETLETKEKDTSTYSDIKKKLRPLIPKTKAPIKRERNMCYCNLLCLCLIPIAIGIVSLVFNPVTYNMCYRAFIFSNATHELQQKIYGQSDAISALIYALNQDVYHLKIICLMGGTGVGKSYTAEIIRKNVPLSGRIFVYDLTLEHSVDAKVLRSFDSYNLLILENLKMKDLNFFASVINVLMRSKDKCITVFAIFNVEHVNNNLVREVDLIESRDTIINTFKGNRIDISIIPYQPLTEKALEMCITEAALYSDLKLTQSQVNAIKQSLLYSGSGCKGAYAKVQVIGRESSDW